VADQPWTGEPAYLPVEESTTGREHLSGVSGRHDSNDADVSQLGSLDWSSALKVFALAVAFVAVVFVAARFFVKT